MSSTATAEVKVKETPILFSSAMVRAILDGRKTQTRRVITPQPHKNVARFVRSLARAGWLEEYDNGDPLGVFTGGKPVTWTQTGKPYKCRYGEAGDRLYVREALKWTDGLAYYADDEAVAPERIPPDFTRTIRDFITSQFMTRWASRITLEITKIRAERLHEISESDALAEGMRRHDASGVFSIGADIACYATARDAFGHGWDSINKKRGFPWSMNPFCWVIEFKKL